MDILFICAFALGVVSSLWSLLYVLLDYYTERLQQLDDLLRQVVYDEVYPQYCLPLLREQLRRWHCSGQRPAARRLFTSLRGTLQLSTDQCHTFQTLCIASLDRQRLWFPRKTLILRLDDTLAQYVWHYPMEEFWEYLEKVHGPFASDRCPTRPRLQCKARRSKEDGDHE